mmetsp:Transcript_51500/g.110357  ORF Transcript_51500/g.110357 Transcript_51500/m.110357 type:complete len:335 (-) Transcript_51500:126-1130(-)
MDCCSVQVFLRKCAASGLLDNVLSFAGPRDILQAAAVDSVWAELLLHDDVWAPLCQSLWRDKIHVKEYSEERCFRAYWKSVVEGRRTAISTAELCAFRWWSRMKSGAGEAWTSEDPWWQGREADIRYYHSDFTTSSARRGPGCWRFVPSCNKEEMPEGNLIRHSRGGMEFPTHHTARTSKWGWVIQNCWSISASFPLPFKGTDPELEDDGPICTRVTVETCWAEAQCFNMGLPLPHQEHSEEDADVPALQLVTLPDGRRVLVPHAIARFLLERGVIDSEDESEGAEMDHLLDGAGHSRLSGSEPTVVSDVGEGEDHLDGNPSPEHNAAQDAQDE